jgi:hypothetical protein
VIGIFALFCLPWWIIAGRIRGYPWIGGSSPRIANMNRLAFALLVCVAFALPFAVIWLAR